MNNFNYDTFVKIIDKLIDQVNSGNNNITCNEYTIKTELFQIEIFFGEFDFERYFLDSLLGIPRPQIEIKEGAYINLVTPEISIFFITDKRLDIVDMIDRLKKCISIRDLRQSRLRIKEQNEKINDLIDSFLSSK